MNFPENSCQLPTGSSGQCIELQQCDTIYQKLLTAPRPIPPGLATEIRSYSCGFTSAGKVNNYFFFLIFFLNLNIKTS